MATQQSTASPSAIAAQDKSHAQHNVAQHKSKAWHGFAAGSASGITKCLVGHPFDTVKVRLQTASRAHFSGPVDCFMQTIRKEGPLGFYKGVTPPLVGWLAMDSVMLGSLTLYRRLLNEHVFNKKFSTSSTLAATDPSESIHARAAKLPAFGHGLAGMLAGWTVSFVAAPVEQVKARLQIQYSADKAQRLYHGPIDCATKLIRAHGIKGIFHGLGATMIFRTSFFFWWGSYDVLTQWMSKYTSMSTPAINFWAGGLSAQVFWLTTYPTDVVKQRIMTDDLANSKFKGWMSAARTIHAEGGAKAFWRGFVPTALRSFPANASALLAFESVMRVLGKTD